MFSGEATKPVGAAGVGGVGLAIGPEAAEPEPDAVRTVRLTPWRPTELDRAESDRAELDAAEPGAAEPVAADSDVADSVAT